MMWMILQAEEAEDWVIATGETTPVRDFVIMAFQHVGITLRFEGSGIEEKGIVVSSENPEYPVSEGQVVVAVDEKYFRPTEVDLLIGDASKAHRKLGWKPEHSLSDLVSDMMKGDLKLMKKEERHC